MSVKKYGIFISYAPGVDLRTEGLGRLLAAFLKAGTQREGIRLVIACPSWTVASLKQLCKSENVPLDEIEIIAPPRKPLLLRVHETLKRFTRFRRPQGLRQRAKRLAWHFDPMQSRRVSQTEHYTRWILLIIFYLPLSVVLALVNLILGGIKFLRAILPYVKRTVRASPRFVALARRMQGSATFVAYTNKMRGGEPSGRRSGWKFQLYQIMATKETRRLVQRINKRDDIVGWYSPTCFIPAFNGITAPRLMCAPDVVVGDFPVGFSGVADRDRYLQVLQLARQSIEGCKHFVTYSEQVKWGTLVDRYRVDPAAVHVVPHAPNALNEWVSIHGSVFMDNIATERHYCEHLLKRALQKAGSRLYTRTFANMEMKYFFYASQFRPSKNLLSLLRAYEYLLRKRFISHKLILTGNIASAPAAAHFIATRRLQNDVLCLPGLTSAELAACYRLADLAVNPSLSEGGCPFTFTEALSVGTPVVMSRLPVALEVLTEPTLTDSMFFDPYDWRDMAARMEWAVKHRDELLAIQQPVYARLTTRSWANVVGEHFAIMDQLAAHASP